LKYQNQKFLTDNDLKISYLGRFPEILIENPELLELFQKEYGRNFLGGDEIISFRQALVSRGMDFRKLENEILETAIKTGKPISEIVLIKLPQELEVDILWEGFQELFWD